MKRLSILTIALVTAIAGCKKDKNTSETSPATGAAAAPADPAPERDGSALWKLAPAGTEAGVVVADGAGVELHRAFIAVASSLETLPMGAALIAELRSETAPLGVDPLRIDGLGGLGLDLSRGAAVFFAGGDPLVVLPVGDRAAFVAKLEGKSEGAIDRFDDQVCKLEGDRYLCAKTAAALEAWKPAAQRLDAGWPAAMRGSIEVQLTGSTLANEAVEGLMSRADRLRAAVQLQRGAALVRVSIDGAVKPMFRTGETPLATAALASAPAGILVGHLGAGIAAIKADMSPQRLDSPGPGGMTMRQMLDSLSGEIVGIAPAGSPARGFVELGLTNPKPARALVSACGIMPLPEGITAEPLENGGCRVTVSELGRSITVDLEVGERALVASVGGGAREGKGGQPLPAYLGGQRWLGALFMRGSIAAALDPQLAPGIDQMVAGSEEAQVAIWAGVHLTELGLGLRSDDAGVHGFLRVATTWANPDPVVNALEPLLLRMARGDLAAAAGVRELAGKHPGTPLAEAVGTGAGGTTASAAFVGMVAAVAIPAFVKYQKRSREAAAPIEAAP